MESLLTNKEKHLLWQDEIGDNFILTKHCEIYRYSKDDLQLTFWNKSQASTVRKLIPSFDWECTDDELCHFKTDCKNLHRILQWCALKRRPYKNGQWLKDKKERLGHEILIYRPQSLQNEPGGEIPKGLRRVKNEMV